MSPSPSRAPGRVAALVAALVVLAACSSSAAGTRVACTLEAGGTSCHCGAAGTASGNTTPCDASSLGGDAECDVYAPPDCGCSEFACTTFDSLDGSIACGYGVPGPVSDRVAPEACSGPHFCLAGTACTCRLTACDASARELSSCTDATAKGAMKGAIAALGSTLVSDCRAATGSAVARTGGK